MGHAPDSDGRPTGVRCSDAHEDAAGPPVVSLLDDARQLAETGPYLVEGSTCVLCFRVIVGFGDVTAEGHTERCPASSWPKILAALEQGGTGVMMQTEPARFACAAPGCDGASRYDYICEGCRERVEAAMLASRPQLLEAMTAERTEVEAWLVSDWAPERRWVIADENYRERALDAVAADLAERTGGAWADDALGFVDDVLYQRRTQHPSAPPRELFAWRVGTEGAAAVAWQEHVAPILRDALQHALATFPLTWAGREYKAALLQQEGYSADDAKDAFEDGLWEGTGKPALPRLVMDAFEAIYYPDPDWIVQVEPGGPCGALWRKYRILPDDIQAILDAYDAVSCQQEATD